MWVPAWSHSTTLWCTCHRTCFIFHSNEWFSIKHRVIFFFLKSQLKTQFIFFKETFLKFSCAKTKEKVSFVSSFPPSPFFFYKFKKFLNYTWHYFLFALYRVHTVTWSETLLISQFTYSLQIINIIENRVKDTLSSRNWNLNFVILLSNNRN